MVRNIFYQHHDIIDVTTEIYSDVTSPVMKTVKSLAAVWGKLVQCHNCQHKLEKLDSYVFLSELNKYSPLAF